MKYFSKHLLTLIILAATFSSCDVESIIDSNFKEKSLVVVAPDFINNRVSVVFKDQDTQELIQDGLEVVVASNKKIIDLSGKYTNKFNVKGGLLQFALDPNEVVSDANPWEMRLVARDAEGKSLPTMAVKKVLKSGSNIWQLSLKKKYITQPKSLAKLSSRGLEEEYYMTFNNERADVFFTKSNPLSGPGYFLPLYDEEEDYGEGLYRYINPSGEGKNLNEDVTLRWGFSNEINRSLFTLNNLEIYYIINDEYYVIWGNFKKGMEVAFFNSLALPEVFSTFNYNSSSAIRLPKEAYGVYIKVLAHAYNKYGVEECPKGFNFNFDVFAEGSDVVLEYKTLRSGPKEGYISSLGYASLANGNSTVNTGEHYISNISNKVVFKEHPRYIIEPQEMDLGPNTACGGNYNFKVYPRVGHERYKLNLQFQCSGEDFSTTPSLEAFMKEEGGTSDPSLVQFDKGSANLALKPDAKYSVQGSFNETSFGFTFTANEDQIEQAVAATIQENSNIENIEYSVSTINQDTVINAKVIFKSGSCPE